MVGQLYELRLVSFKEMKEPAHLALHPFGKIPTYEEGDLALFESGAIVLHIAESHPGLLPGNANERARATAWMFAALNTVERPIVEREASILMEKDKNWYEERMTILDERVHERREELSRALGTGGWLDGDFTEHTGRFPVSLELSKPLLDWHRLARVARELQLIRRQLNLQVQPMRMRRG
jgi:glutathione S-transferase